MPQHNLRDGLANWYYCNYFQYKHGRTDSLGAQAENFADSVLNRDREYKHPGHISNVKGALGEILACAALNQINNNKPFHGITDRALDSQGIDILAGKREMPILGLGVKLAKNGLPLRVQSLPLVNIRFDEETYCINEFLEQQAKGILYSPKSYVKGLFCNKEIEEAFIDTLGKRLRGAVNRGVIQPNMPAFSYAKRFID